MTGSPGEATSVDEVARIEEAVSRRDKVVADLLAYKKAQLKKLEITQKKVQNKKAKSKVKRKIAKESRRKNRGT